MRETSKTVRIMQAWEKEVLSGRGIDIGAGDDPLPCFSSDSSIVSFDTPQGDAGRITQCIESRDFDFVYSAHCLEHLEDPQAALRGWWELLRPGGHLFLIVPDEDLYEQGVFPSRFSDYHRFTFTIAKQASWSPRSLNLLDLMRQLPDAELVDIQLQDTGYDRTLIAWGKHSGRAPVDQTRGNALAQIRCIVRKYHE